MNKSHAGFLVQIVHAESDLFGPVEQNVGCQVTAVERLVQAASAGVLHHQTQVRLLRADALQFDDVGMLEEREQRRLAPDTFQIFPRIVAQRTCHLYGHLQAGPKK